MGESKYVIRGRMRVLREDPNAGEELEGMNRGKVGAPYRYAKSLFMVLALIRFTSHMSYECLEGYAREMLGEMNAPRHAQICRRINALKVDIRDGVATVYNGARAVRLAADASGLQQHNRGEWIRKKWRHRRGFVKIHILVDIDTRQILALRVTDEKIGDSPVFAELLAEAVKFLDAAVAAADDPGRHDQAAEADAADAAADAATAAMCRASEDAVATLLNRDRSPVRVLEASVSAAVTAAAAAAGRVIYADSAYASRQNLCLCKECGVMPFIMLKKNATTAGKGHGDVWGGSVRGQRGRGARNVSALTETERADALEEWKENSGYGKRWIVEIIFSAFKRLFGSDVRALKWDNIVQEIKLKVWAYNMQIGTA